MCNTFHFPIFTAPAGIPFEKQLSDLQEQLQRWLQARGLSVGHLVFSRVYLTDAANQAEVLRRHPLYGACLSVAAFSYVEQPLIGGAKVALHAWVVDAEDILRSGGSDRMKVRIGAVNLLFQSVRLKEEEARGLGAYEQTELAFCRHINWLAEENMNLSEHCHRTWLYVRDVDRNYAGVVAARNKVFDGCGLTADTHFIASTGIGGASDNRQALVASDFFSVCGTDSLEVKYLQALDYLNPTAEYGVAFERGTALTLLSSRLRFISGTASIDNHGNCLYRGDVAAQTERMFLNISKLLEDDGASLADVAYFVVYLRDISDYVWVNDYMERRFPSTPRLIVEARVCRPEWLVEAECVAVS